MSQQLLARHVLELAIRPALDALGPAYSTPAAERLVLGTAAVESGFGALRQHGLGPALGFWQMEPATARDLRDRFLAGRPQLRIGVLRFATGGMLTDIEPHELAWNLRLGAAFCRLRYVMDPRPLPDADDLQGQAETWKRTYNSYLGAGTVDHYLRAWQMHCAKLFPGGELA